MATLIFMKTALFTMKIVTPPGTLVEYEGDVKDAHVEVTTGDVVEYPTLDGNVAANKGPDSYALVLAGGQDYSASGLARFLWDNADKVADIVLNAYGKSATPSTATPSIKGQVTISPVAYGGEVGTFAEFDVTLPFLAKPTLAII